MTSARRSIPRGVGLLSLVFALLLVLVTAILTYRSLAALRRSTDQAAITRKVVDESTTLISSLKDAETGQRGFLLTGEEHYLEPYRQALTAVPSSLDAVLRIERAELRPEQLQRVDRLKPLVQTKMDELAETIELRRKNDPEAALAIVRTDRGKAIMDQIRVICAELQAISYELLERQNEEASASAYQAGIIGSFGSAGVFVLLVIATINIQRGIERRQQLIESLQQSEEQTREARDWLQTTITSIGDGVVATDSAGKVIFLNPVAQSLTGWTQDEAAARPLEEIFIITNEATGAVVENPVIKVLREGKVVGLANHTNLTAKDGRLIPIDDSAAPIRASDGRIYGVVLVFRDITARRDAEIAIQRNIKELVRVNEDLNQFAFAASHDLQEPLRMITSYSQLLLKGYEGQLDGDAAICVNFITAGTKRMSDLLADLLAYTQVSADGQNAGAAVDLNLILLEATANLSAMIDGSKALITSEQLPVVRGEEAHFVQLFQNLIGNAIKYRGPDIPQVRVSAAKMEDGWRIAVADNGIGIAPEYHQRIFGVFKRLHGSTIPGTGIGLAICQRVVDRFGGQIWVESQLNHGATFFFTVPSQNH